MRSKGATIIVIILTVIIAAGAFYLTYDAPQDVAPRPTPGEVATARVTRDPTWTHTAVVRVNDETGAEMKADANVWDSASRTNVRCTIPRGRIVDVSPQWKSNDSMRVKSGSCEGWIGVIQLDRIEQK